MMVIRWAKAWVIDHVLAVTWQWQHLRHPAVPARYTEGNRAPVLLLPGVYETWQFLAPVADRLNALGHPVHLVKEIGYNRQPVIVAAAIAERYLLANDLSHVIIVAHSKGGLIGKQLMVSDAVRGRIDRMVAINSPFSGNRFARFAPVAPLRAFAPSNSTLKTLAANLEANSRITSIFARLDPVIPEGSRLEAATNIELPLTGHFRPLRQGVLLDAIDRAVEGTSAQE